MAEVLRKERLASESVGGKYAVRPASYKGSLSLKQDRYTVRKKSRSRSPTRDRMMRERKFSGRRSPSPPTAIQQPREVSREQQERMKRIVDKYGDASAK